MATTYTFNQFRKDYPDDAACLAEIMRLRYGPEPTCHECKRKTKYHRIAKRRAYACQFCGAHVYPCVGTIFEKSTTPLNKWFFAMYLFTTTRHGVAAKELERQLGVTYKCAWRMARQIRKLMSGLDVAGLFGEVEVDETYVGGKRPGKRGRGAGGKTVGCRPQAARRCREVQGHARCPAYYGRAVCAPERPAGVNGLLG